MNPPLRTREDIHAIKEGLKDGTIDAIATDHAPHASHEKQLEFADAPFGVVGLETAWPLTLSLVEEGVLPLEQAVAMLTTGPARAFGLAQGTLAPGVDADVVIIDPEAQWEVDPNKFHSKSRNSPFAGWKVRVYASRCRRAPFGAAVLVSRASCSDQTPRERSAGSPLDRRGKMPV